VTVVTRQAAGALPEQGPELERLVAQRGFFAAPFDRVPDEVYATAEGVVTCRRAGALLSPRSRVSQNTYFGRFPASYWQRWTSATEVVLETTVSGSGRICVRGSDFEGSPRTLATRDVADTDGDRVDVAVPIDRFVDGGAVWAEFATGESTLEIGEVRWSVDAPPVLRPTALVMCTHDRADDCLFTLGVLAGDHEARRMLDAVYVVDQGGDPVESRAAFAEVAAELGPALHYLRQPNLGGAGGFTRGLYEVAHVEGAGHANVLFMDDDILLEPDVVVRLTAFANRTVEPVIVGAQMLHLLHPTKLHVGAETARFTTVEPGLAVPNALDRADVTEEFQELRVDADYNAWWTCLIPSEVVSDAGYPMPFFFQWDDVEYGYRARARGHATVTLPGAAVWHHDFDWKDEDDWARYFTLRNAMMIDALHGDFRPAASAKVAGRWIAECLVSMRYGEAATLVLAVEDFLRGAESLRDGGVAALRAVRELRAAYPETVRHTASSVPGQPAAGRPIAHAPWGPSRETAVLVKRLLRQLRGPAGGTVSISAEQASWWHVSRFGAAVVTDRSQEGVRMRRYDREALVRIARHAASTLWRLRRDGDRAAEQLRAATPELTSREHWRGLFEAQHTHRDRTDASVRPATGDTA
jgi:galactofuranosylgalactofuranosylrhamnosyl-N-acetylglucosaminyl-diphospho-decaprenol beta-1,5/1,6-galactofuranosyltransferase